MPLTEVVQKDPTPADVPEGNAVVVVSATLFAWMTTFLPGKRTIEWGEPIDQHVKNIYTPVVSTTE